MDKSFKFGLGSKLKDTITGFEGVAIGRTQWLHNCHTYMIKSQELKDGKPIDAISFEEDQLVAIEKKPEQPPVRHGGPHDNVSVNRSVCP